jgi:hypothetical protein
MKEAEYKDALLQIANWILNPQNGSTWQPLNAHFANQIGNFALDVAHGMSVQEAIEKNK